MNLLFAFLDNKTSRTELFSFSELTPFRRGAKIKTEDLIPFTYKYYPLTLKTHFDCITP